MNLTIIFLTSFLPNSSYHTAGFSSPTTWFFNASKSSSGINFSCMINFLSLFILPSLFNCGSASFCLFLITYINHFLSWKKQSFSSGKSSRAKSEQSLPDVYVVIPVNHHCHHDHDHPKLCYSNFFKGLNCDSLWSFKKDSMHPFGAK